MIVIFDNKQMFFDGETIASNTVSKVVPNLLEGESTGVQQNAGNQLYLFAKSNGATADTAITLQTAENKGFTIGVKTIGQFTLKALEPLKTKVPIGSLGYYRITATGTGGTIVSGLVVDVDIQ